MHQKVTHVGDDKRVQRVILIEGAANFVVLVVKVFVGLATGSLAIMSDALHSLTDVANNFIAWAVVKQSQKPADKDHPYGHRKFEALAVLGLSFLLAVLAFEIVIRAFSGSEQAPGSEPWELWLMIGVLVINVALASWQKMWANRLHSDILDADAKHTFADSLTTIVVIIGWQFAADGYAWLDSLAAVFVSAIIFYLAYSLFRKAAPSLLDQYAVDPEELTQVVKSVTDVRGVKRVRSRRVGRDASVDLVVLLDGSLSNNQSHQICDRIESAIESRFGISDVSIHIEPDLH